MNRKLLIVLVIVILLIAGSVAYLLLMPKESMTSTVEDTSQNGVTEDTNLQSDANEQQQPENQSGAYKDYSESEVNETSGTKVLFFHAPWCPQCRELEASIRDSAIPDNVTIFKVDYDTNQALRSTYGVTLQTTLVKINDDGSLIKKYVAYDEPTFASVEENLLK